MALRFLSFLTVLLTSLGIMAQAIPVKIEKSEKGYYLTRAGEEFYIRGAGGSEYLDYVLEAGGNSIRTWSASEAGAILDEAHAKGLTVMFGLWVGHERHGFDYNDEKAVQAQFERFKKIVEKYKDHPAILLWGIGNEVDLFYSNTKVWDAIQDIAKMVHELDPNHPTTTVTAGIDSSEISLIKSKAPDIDILSVNTYGEINRVPDIIHKNGWEGPWLISEWGPTGHWEVQKTKWGVPLEQTSKEKAQVYTDRYMNYINAFKGECVGSYVFLWGQKQETTSTWYGIFTEKGERTETYDAVYSVWKGSAPDEKAPRLDSITLDGKRASESIYLKSKQEYEAKAFVEDYDQKLNYDWAVVPESDDIKAGGDAEEAPEALYNLVKKTKGNEALIRAPKKEGAYRLFLYARSQNSKVAYANIPFYVLPGGADEESFVKFKKQELKPVYE